MKTAILLFSLLLATTISKAQNDIVHSTCTAPDSITTKYKTDAQRMALSRIYQTYSAYKDSAAIQQSCTDTFLRSIIAVYNALSIPERDSVVTKYAIHSRPFQAYDTNAYGLNSVILQVDKTQQWMQDILQNTIPTSNTTVNQLLTKYGLFNSFISQYTSATAFSSLTNYNMNAVAKDWLSVPGVYTADGKGSVAGDGNYLLATDVTNTYIELVFSYGYGDCPSGCIWRKNWMFRTYYNCDVEFIKSWEGQIPSSGIGLLPAEKKVFSIYPNPTGEILNIRSTGNTSYRITDVTGRTIKIGSFIDGVQIHTNNMASGLYFLHLNNGIVETNSRIIKN